MTDDELTAIEQRAEAATPHADSDLIRYDHGGGRLALYGDVPGERTLIADFYEEPDREFYVAARDDVLALCREVRRLTDRLRLLFDENANLDADIGRLTAELAELRKRPTLAHVEAALFECDTYGDSVRAIRQLYGEEQPHD